MSSWYYCFPNTEENRYGTLERENISAKFFGNSLVDSSDTMRAHTWKPGELPLYQKPILIRK